MESDPMNMEKLACRCHNVSYGKIYDAVRNGARTVEEVSRATGAGTGCGKCREFLDFLVRDFLREMEQVK